MSCDHMCSSHAPQLATLEVAPRQQGQAHCGAAASAMTVMAGSLHPLQCLKQLHCRAWSTCWPWHQRGRKFTSCAAALEHRFYLSWAVLQVCQRLVLEVPRPLPSPQQPPTTCCCCCIKGPAAQPCTELWRVCAERCAAGHCHSCHLLNPPMYAGITTNLLNTYNSVYAMLAS
jgi:hypothetical protein